MKKNYRSFVFALALTGAAGPALAQNTSTPPYPDAVISLSGPRFGITYLSEGVIEKLQERHIDVGNVVSQFGWQFEKRFYSSDNGVTAVTEAVLLVGGLDQSVVLPSLSWLVGIRTPGGSEFGIGPNITPAGVALAAAMGVTFRAGALNVPVNVAVVPSKSGMRVSFLTGFNMRR